MWMSCGRPTLQQLGVFKPAPPLKTAFYSITKVKDPLIKDQSEHRARWGIRTSYLYAEEHTQNVLWLIYATETSLMGPL